MSKEAGYLNIGKSIMWRVWVLMNSTPPHSHTCFVTLHLLLWSFRSNAYKLYPTTNKLGLLHVEVRQTRRTAISQIWETHFYNVEVVLLFNPYRSSNVPISISRAHCMHSHGMFLYHPLLFIFPWMTNEPYSWEIWNADQQSYQERACSSVIHSVAYLGFHRGGANFLWSLMLT